MNKKLLIAVVCLVIGSLAIFWFKVQENLVTSDTWIEGIGIQPGTRHLAVATNSTRWRILPSFKPRPKGAFDEVLNTKILEATGSVYVCDANRQQIIRRTDFERPKSMEKQFHINIAGWQANDVYVKLTGQSEIGIPVTIYYRVGPEGPPELIQNPSIERLVPIISDTSSKKNWLKGRIVHGKLRLQFADGESEKEIFYIDPNIKTLSAY